MMNPRFCEASLAALLLLSVPQTGWTDVSVNHDGKPLIQCLPGLSLAQVRAGILTPPGARDVLVSGIRVGSVRKETKRFPGGTDAKYSVRFVFEPRFATKNTEYTDYCTTCTTRPEQDAALSFEQNCHLDPSCGFKDATKVPAPQGVSKYDATTRLSVLTAEDPACPGVAPGAIRYEVNYEATVPDAFIQQLSFTLRAGMNKTFLDGSFRGIFATMRDSIYEKAGVAIPAR